MIKQKNRKDLVTLFWTVIVELSLITSGFYLGNHFQIFHLTREQSSELIKETLSNYISLLGIGLAILAILISIIQLTYKRLSIVKLILDNTYFAPLFYFGSINILFSATWFFWGFDLNFISDNFFIRGTVILSYLFLVLVVFLGVVFVLTLKNIDYSQITESYLKNVKKLVTKESENINLGETLQTISIELRNEVEANISENKTTVIDKIFDVYSYTLEKNPSSTIIRFLRFYVRKWMIETYKAENYIVFNNLLNNWRRMYREGILSQEDARRNTFKLFPSELYLEGVNKLDEDIKKLVVDSFPIRLKEEAQAIVWNSKAIKSDIEELEKTFKLIEPILFDFNELIHVITLSNDAKLNEVLNELKMLEEIHDVDSDYRDIDFNLKLGSIDPEIAKNITPLDIKRYTIYKSFYQDTFALKYGNLSWLYYQCFTRRIKYEDVKNSIAIIEQTLQIDRIDFLKNVIKIFSNTKFKYNWHEWIWQAEERLSGTTYSLENEESFLAIGFIVNSIKVDLSSDYTRGLNKDEIAESEHLIYWVKSTFEFFKPRRSIWMQVLQISEESELDNYFKITEEFLQNLNGIKEAHHIQEVIRQPISQEKVDSFRTKIEKQWNESRTVDRIFEFFNAVEINPPEKLQFIGHGRINFKKAKILFVEKLHQDIYGINYGHEVCKYINNYLFTKIRNDNQIEQITTPTLLEALNHAFLQEVDKEKMNVVFVSLSSWVLIERDVLSTGNYLSSQTEPSKLYPFEYLGIYKNSLVIIPIRSNILKKSIVAMNIPKAIRLIRRTNKCWIHEKLQLDILEIDQSNAEELIIKQGLKPPFEQAMIDEIKTGIFIEIGETLDFKILDNALIKVYNVSP